MRWQRNPRHDGPGRLSALDAAFFDLETDVQSLSVGALIVCGGGATSTAELMDLIESRIPATPGLTWQISPAHSRWSHPRWQVDVGFDLSSYVHAGHIEAPGDDQQLRDFMVQRMAEPMACEGPLWQAWIVDGMSGGRFAVALKAHHSLLDGSAGRDLLALLLGAQEGGAAPEGPPAAAFSVRERLHGLTALAHRDLPASLLNGPLCGQRTWNWAGTDLEGVRAYAHSRHATVNDVVLAEVTGAVGQYLRYRDEQPEDLELRCLVPVSMRKIGNLLPLPVGNSLPLPTGNLSPLPVGNAVSAFFVDLPIGLVDPAERLAVVREQTRVMRSGPTPAGIRMALRAADHVPQPILGEGMRRYARRGQRRVNLVVSNVPGPSTTASLCGRPVLEVHPFAPLGQEVRVVVAVTSYAGRLSIGVTSDSRAIPDAHMLCAYLQDALDAAAAGSGRRL